jgi:hypothetical protein
MNTILALPLTLASLVIYYIVGFKYSLISNYETVELIVGSITFLLTFGYIGPKLLGSHMSASTISTVLFFFVNWYFWMKVISRSMNKDLAGHVRY